MRDRRIHLLLFLAALTAVVCLAVRLLSQLGNAIQLPPQLGLSGCKLDPARLPPVSGPEGQSANYLHTCGRRLYDSQGREVRITGLNWYGMESSGYAPEGLGNRNWHEILDQIAALGYNTIRLPFSNEALEPQRRVNGIHFAINPDLEDLSGLEMLDHLIEGARERGLKIVLDRHQPTPRGRTPLWYTEYVPEERWIADWVMLASRYNGNDTVIGFDLHNEPRDMATWGSGDLATDWRLAAERAGNAVLERNPYLLIFVEGIENYNGDHYWWGGDLQGVRTAPVRLKVPNRVVYSPHDYGPNVSDQAWFWDPDFPNNLPALWDRRWGYIQRDNIAPVVVGEFGGRSVGDDPEGRWQTTLLTYLRTKEIGALIWSLNPSWDAGGILAGDWKTVESVKQEAYQQILAPPLSTGSSGTFGKAATRLKVVYRSPASEQDRTTLFSFKIENDGPEEIDYARLELRYWLKTGDSFGSDDRSPSESSQSGDVNIATNLEPTDRGGQDHYLQIRFSSNATALAPYRMSNEIAVRCPKTLQQGHSYENDYSHASFADFHDRFREWDRVTLYLDGELVWGREP